MVLVMNPNDARGADVGEDTMRERDDRARRAAFDRARRHSRLVGLLKFMLPVAALAMIGGFVGYSWLAAPATATVEVSGGTISDGKLVMAAPKLEGFTKDNLAYSMKAERAVQDAKATGVFQLENIEAKLPVDADTWATVKSRKGIYDRDKNTIKFTTAVEVATNDGMRASFTTAFYDIGRGELKTSDPVDIRLNGTQIAADSMKALDNGKVLIFENRVRMEIEPGRMKAGQATSGDGNGQ